MEREEMGTEISHNPISLRRQQEEKQEEKNNKETAHHVRTPYVTVRKRWMTAKQTSPEKIVMPPSPPLASHSFILPRWTRVRLRNAGTCSKIRNASSARRGRGGKRNGKQKENDSEFISIGGEEKEEAGGERTAKMRNRTDGETWSTLCLWSSGEGERPSMWRTCRLLPSRPRSAAGGRARGARGARSRRRRDSRHAKSDMPTGRVVCDRGFRAMEIGESWATRTCVSSDFSPSRGANDGFGGSAAREIETRLRPRDLARRKPGTCRLSVQKEKKNDYARISKRIARILASQIWSRSQYCRSWKLHASVVALRVRQTAFKLQ